MGPTHTLNEWAAGGVGEEGVDQFLALPSFRQVVVFLQSVVKVLFSILWKGHLFKGAVTRDFLL